MLTSNTLYRLLVLAVVITGLTASVDAVGQDADMMYRLVELNADGGGSSKAYAINNTGQIVGWMESGESRHAGHWHVEVSTDLHGTVHFSLQHPYALFDEDYSEAFDISNGDQIVGTARVGINCPPKVILSNAFILRAATLTDLATPYAGDALTNLRTLGVPCGDPDPDPNSPALIGAPDSTATGISNRNHVVGWADTNAGVIRAFLTVPVDGQFFLDVAQPFYVNDLMIDLGTLRGDSDPVSSASAVNDWGEVTGYSYTLATPAGAADPIPKAAYHAFVILPDDIDGDGRDEWFVNAGDGANALMHDLGTLGGYNSWGRDINTAGQIVGESDTDPNMTGNRNLTHAFLWDGGVMTDLGALEGGFSAASAINDEGDVVGWSTDADGQRRAFIYRNGRMYDLNDLICTVSAQGMTFIPNISLVEARDINEDGWIVGWGNVRGTDADGTRGFLLIPIDPADCVVDDGENTDGSGDSSGSQPGSGTGSAYDGKPIQGTPGTLGDGSSQGNAGDDDTQAPPVTAPALCGFGAFAFLPLAMLGLFGVKSGVGRRLSRRERSRCK